MKQAIIILFSAIFIFGCAKKATQVVATPKPIVVAPVPVVENKTQDTSITYTVQIKPIIDKYCTNCHNGKNYNIPLNNYQSTKMYVDNGEIYKHVFVVKNMPPRSEPQLTTDELKILLAWLNTGAKE